MIDPDAPARFSADEAGAAALDAVDPLRSFRDEFVVPEGQIYFVGNSLGAMPRAGRDAVVHELDRWSSLGVAGHFTPSSEAERGWAAFHELLTGPMAAVVGARPDEVVVMNSLTVNLHLLMISFYRPTSRRHKILIEDHAFPSDHFAVESQIRQRGFDPVSSLVTVAPRPGQDVLDPADVLAAIAEHGEELALVLLPGVQYYTGQVLPMSEIVTAGHAVGAKVGLDLAHAAGNVPLSLHDWGPDFAAWCTYKYLNGGPGSTAGCFVHQRHHGDQDLHKLLGWWGTNPATRFEMENRFDPIPTVESWQISNPAILSTAPLRASLDIVERAGGPPALRAKSELQIGYLDHLLTQVIGDRVELLNPSELDRRGCQFAVAITDPDRDGREVYEGLKGAGVACDWRYPRVIRVAPVPLYNSFIDIFRFVQILDDLV